MNRSGRARLGGGRAGVDGVWKMVIGAMLEQDIDAFCRPLRAWRKLTARSIVPTLVFCRCLLRECEVGASSAPKPRRDGQAG